MQIFSLFGLTAVTIIACLLLGGGTRSSMLSDGVLQLLAIPLLLSALWHWLDRPSDRRRRRVLALSASFALIFFVQLLPLPPAIWTMLPHREPIIESFRLIDGALPWRPLSLAPTLTWSSLLAFIAPLGVFLAASGLAPPERRRLALLILPVSALSVFLGLLQVAQGEESPLRFFSYTNPSEAVGLFANRNHFSALLYCSIVVATTWFAESTMTSERSKQTQGFDVTSFVPAIAAATMVVVLMSGQAMARSRAGIALTFFALIGAFALAYATKRRSASNVASYKLLLGAMAVATALCVQFALYRILARFDAAGMLDDTRLSVAHRAIGAANALFPFGAGFGTFVPVYATFEHPEDALVSAYINHAHNDFLELYFESGLFGIALVVAFCSWWGLRSWRLWRQPTGPAAEVDEPYALAATVIVALLFLHSFVDYPLRTTAMMTYFALACALMIEPPTSQARAPIETRPLSSVREPSPKKAARPLDSHKSTRPPARPAATVSRETEPTSQPSSRIQSSELEWPEEWRDK